MAHLPSLPVGGPLRILAMAGSGAVLAFAASSIVLWAERRRRPAAWAAAPLVACVLSFTLGRLLPLVHPIASAMALVLAGRNLWQLTGVPRALQGVGIMLWMLAMTAAAILFGR